MFVHVDTDKSMASKRSCSSIFLLHLEPSRDSEFRLFLHENAHRVSAVVGSDNTHQYHPHCSLTGYFQVFHETPDLSSIPLNDSCIQQTNSGGDAVTSIRQILIKSLINSLVCADEQLLVNIPGSEKLSDYLQTLNYPFSDASSCKSTRAGSGNTVSSFLSSSRFGCDDESSNLSSPINNPILEINDFIIEDFDAFSEADMTGEVASKKDSWQSEAFLNTTNSTNESCFECDWPLYTVILFDDSKVNEQDEENFNKQCSILTTETGHVLIPLKCNDIIPRLKHMGSQLGIIFDNRLERYKNAASMRRLVPTSSSLQSESNQNHASIADAEDASNTTCCSSPATSGGYNDSLAPEPCSKQPISLKHSHHISIAEGRDDAEIRELICSLYSNSASTLMLSLKETFWDVVLYQLDPQEVFPSPARLPLKEIFRIKHICNTDFRQQ